MKRDATAQINQFNSSDHQKSSILTKKFKEPTFVVWRKKPYAPNEHIQLWKSVLSNLD